MKELLINGKVFAKYELEDDPFNNKGKTIFIKVIIQVFPDNPAMSEVCLISIIQLIENVKFKTAAYLNV